MVSQVISSTENNFTKGLITEFTGLNFPENAATDTDNCIYTLVGDVTRREGINYEDNFTLNSLALGGSVNSYKWNNAGGDGESQIVVIQNGSALNFYKSSNATITSPLSSTLIPGLTISLLNFATGTTPDPSTLECQFSDGNGYLFVYHPACDPFFCSYNGSTVTATKIQIQIRDFAGVAEVGNPNVNVRPSSLTNDHLYNLTNQGWTQGSPYQLQSTSSNPAVALGSQTFTVGAGAPVTLGDLVNITTVNTTTPGGNVIPSGTSVMSGTITSYSGTTLVVNITSIYAFVAGSTLGPYNITPFNHGYINTWFSDVGNYPSNADVWWYFKDNTGVFNPTSTASQVTLNTGPAPSGHIILNAFTQQRSLVSGISGLTDVITSVRPRTGTWFQGRVWYAGVDASQPAAGDSNFYTWTENLYFSQIVTDSNQFGQCYQTNDPASENLSDLLPTDGGVVQIQGAGAIYKLFPIQNGMLVFAANGIWFITGSQGIGFSANDYTVTKISAVQSISSTSFVDVQGLPYFWNEEGIYSVTPSQNGSLTVDPITVGTILTFYNEIPLASKQYVRGAYHPIDYIIQWTFRSTSDNANITSRYQYDRILNYNTYNKAFYPYSITGTPHISGILYVASPNVSAPDPAFKYLTTLSEGSHNFTFSEENDDGYVDWGSSTPVNYVSYFVTGYKLHGQGQKRFQLPYIYVYSKADTPTAYTIQSVWDYASSGLSGKYSSVQTIYNNKPYFGMIFRRHRLRGQGIVLQIKISSVDGSPFDVMGWSTFENLNQGV